MLTKRQIEIFLELYENQNEYLKAKHFSESMDVSLRTIQNDLKAIKEEMTKHGEALNVESKVPFGTRIIIHNAMKAQKFVDSLKTNDDSLNYQNDRLHRLLSFLLNQRRSISLNKCADFIYVSKSTLLNDLQKLDLILNKYSLHLIQSKGYVWIDGLERDKRMCLIEYDNKYINIILSSSLMDSEGDNIDYIRHLLMDIFLEKQYNISDLDFQNVVIWINISVKRIMNFFYLNEEDINDNDSVKKEMELAQNIYDRLEKHFLIRVPQPEINFLALYIKNHSNFSDTDYISNELNDFIVEALAKIKESYPTDFTHDMDLRISLALHCAPLISRARNNAQIKNELLDYIKKNFPYAFDVATFFSYLLSNRFDCKIQESETAFLAIYFNKSISDHAVLKESKRLCIISNLKRSEYFLIEQLFYNRYHQYISSLDFVTNTEINHIDLDQYDLFFSTEDNHAVEVGLATKISVPLTQKDLETIQVRINGFKNINDIMKLFDPRLFNIKEEATKADIQQELVSRASEIYHTDNLAAEIELREEFGSTYFGNGIAILHPMHSTQDDSFIGTVVCTKPIIWDAEGNRVNIAFLVCIAKNNLEAFRAWDYLVPLLFDNAIKNALMSVNSFDDFYAICEKQLKKNLNN